jgi:dihydropteroate synthase
LPAGWPSAALRCRQAGIAEERIVLDPGFGFGKTLAHNLVLFQALSDDVWHGFPLLVGVSRKSMLGQITGRPVSGRQAASVAAALLAAQKGAAVLRVHDVAETRDALTVWSAVLKGEENELENTLEPMGFEGALGSCRLPLIS